MAQLDVEQPEPPEVRRLDPLASDIRHFIRVVSPVTRAVDTRRSTLPVITAETADAIVAGCRLIERVGRDWPEIVTGPIDLGRQYWISTDRPSNLSPRQRRPDRRYFEAPLSSIQTASTKPFNLGLFTASGSAHGFGMWWWYLQARRGSSLFAEPWGVWHLEFAESSRVLEISTATAWLELVSCYRVEQAGMLYPDWMKIAERWDAVHMTLPAIAATQAIGLAFGNAATAPTNWDVESTLWLRWLVATATLVQPG